MIELYPGSSEYLFDGYNGVSEKDYEEQARAGFGEFGYLEQGYYDLDDDIPPTYDYEEQLLEDFYGEYYTNGDYLKEGITRDSLLEDAYEYIDYNNSFGYYEDYYGYGGYYGYAGYGSYGTYSEEQDSVGKKKPEHSIENPVNIKKQSGPKCSAYASSCLLRYYGKETEPSELYDKFLKLPDGSAIPSSVSKVIGAKLHTHGKISDIEKKIDQGKPVLALVYYDEEPGWDNLHYILVTGYDEEYIYIADSLHASGKRYYNRKIKRKTFNKMWNTSKSILVKMFYGRNIYYEYDGDKAA